MKKSKEMPFYAAEWTGANSEKGNKQLLSAINNFDARPQYGNSNKRVTYVGNVGCMRFAVVGRYHNKLDSL